MENHAESTMDMASSSPGGVSDHTPTGTPYEYSLIGEYLRLTLLLVAVPLLMWFVQLGAQRQPSVASMIAIGVLGLTLVSNRGFAWLRSILVVAMTINVLALVVNPEAMVVGQNASPFKIPNVILLACLATASVFELNSLARQSSRRTLIKASCWSLLAIPAIAYAAGIPLVNSLWASLFPGQVETANLDPDWTMSREISLRFAKFAVFAAFTYLGACLGSFLNVVAWCVPRGKSIALRDSCCPKCNEKIKRIDNLPIFSYINLSAACRNCKAAIPVRYLIVELTVAIIFGSLFLCELVTGAANVPGAKVPFYAGILWVIMYPNWSVIAVYVFHALFMSMLLVLALIELDRQKLKWQLIAILLAAFALPAILYFPVQPVPLGNSISMAGDGKSVLVQLLKVVAGGMVGGVVGAISRFAWPKVSMTFVPAMIMSGVVLGWQSVLHVSVLFAVIMLAARFLPSSVRVFLKESPSMALVIAVMVHHPFWRFVFETLAV